MRAQEQDCCEGLQSALLQIFALLLSGDVELNPGPPFSAQQASDVGVKTFLLMNHNFTKEDILQTWIGIVEENVNEISLYVSRYSYSCSEAMLKQCQQIKSDLINLYPSLQQLANNNHKCIWLCLFQAYVKNAKIKGLQLRFMKSFSLYPTTLRILKKSFPHLSITQQTVMDSSTRQLIVMPWKVRSPSACQSSQQYAWMDQPSFVFFTNCSFSRIKRWGCYPTASDQKLKKKKVFWF